MSNYISDFQEKDEAWTKEMQEEQKRNMAQRVVDAMNDAVNRDKVAMITLLRIMIPCNEDLAEDPYIVVGEDKVLGGYTFGVLGCINGVLGALNVNLIATKWSDEADEEGRHDFLGFCVHEPLTNTEDSTEKMSETA